MDGFQEKSRPRRAPQSSTPGGPARRGPPWTASGRDSVHGGEPIGSRRVHSPTVDRSGARSRPWRVGRSPSVGTPARCGRLRAESRPRRGAKLLATGDLAHRGRLRGEIPSAAGKLVACERNPCPPWTGMRWDSVHGGKPRSSWTVAPGGKTRRGRVPRGIPSTERNAIVHAGRPRPTEPALDGFGAESRPRRETGRRPKPPLAASMRCRAAGIRATKPLVI